MGLAERKVKQRIGYDPRNLTWSNDKDRFSFKHMQSLGWDDSKGIGKDQQGNKNHIAVAQKLDNSGIGMGRARKEGQDLSAGAGQAGAGLADVLARLAAAKSASASAAASPVPSHEASPAPESASASPGPSTLKRNKIASRQKHLHSKRLATQNAAALAEILGVPVSSLPSSPAASTPATPAAESAPESPAESGASTPTESSDQRNVYETISTSTVSVSDYFRQKLREKALARQAASGSSTPVPTMSEGSLAVIKDEVKVAIGGVAWEGSKMAFAEVTEEVVLGDLGADAPAIPKEEKKKEKKSKRKSEAATPDEASSTPVDDKAAKKARKEEKRARKEEKAAAKAAKKEAKASKSSSPDAGDKKKRKRDDGEDGERKRKSKSKSE